MEAHFPYGTGTVVYDSAVISAEQIAKLLAEKTPFPASILSDQQIVGK